MFVNYSQPHAKSL